MDQREDPEHVVEEGYDRIAEQYLAYRERYDAATLVKLEELAGHLSRGARVLDLGCGAGLPVTAWLARQYAVTGVDISARQIELARRNVPGATFIKADMTTVDFPSETFDAAVAVYSIIHVPREKHPALVRNISRWLKPGGLFLATWANKAWEGMEEDWKGWGAPMWWSHGDFGESLAVLNMNRFLLLSLEEQTEEGETWFWVLTQKPEPF